MYQLVLYLQRREKLNKAGPSSSKGEADGVAAVARKKLGKTA